MNILFRGRGASKGRAEGEALVCHGPLKFLFPVDDTEGVIYEPGHELHGKSVKGKVIFCSSGCGCSWHGLYVLKTQGANPKAVVAMKPYHQLVDDIVFIEIPMVYDFDRNLLDKVETGDHVVVDGDKGTVTVTKKS